MSVEPALLAALALFGGVAAVDGTSFGQVMISRPLVACVLAGWIAGNPAVGAMVGVVQEALHLAVLPVGASRYPEAAPAAVAAAGVYVALVDGRPEVAEAALLVATLFVLLWEWACAGTVQLLRSANVRLAVPPGPVDGGWVERRHLGALLLDFARGAVMTALGALLLAAILGALPLAAVPRDAARLAVGVAAAAALASALRLLGRRRILWFGAGALLGLLLLGLG